MSKKSGNFDLKDKIYEDLKEGIISLRYKPGEILSEDHLKEEYGVSRTPIREALIKLQSENLVNIIPRGITCVSQIDINSFKEVLEVKTYLLDIVICISIEKMNEELKQKLRELVSNKEIYMKVTDIPGLMRINDRYNKVLADSCMNNELREIMTNINSKTLRYFNYFLHQVNDRTIEKFKLLTYNIHLKIYQCIEEKAIDKVKDILEDHYQKTLSIIRESII